MNLQKDDSNTCILPESEAEIEGTIQPFFFFFFIFSQFTSTFTLTYVRRERGGIAFIVYQKLTKCYDEVMQVVVPKF